MLRLQKIQLQTTVQMWQEPMPSNTLSRACLPTSAHFAGAKLEHINAAAFLLMSTLSLQEIQQVLRVTKQWKFSRMSSRIPSRWPEHCSQVPSQIPSMRDKLANQDVVPVSLRCDMKQKLYASHLGAESCLLRVHILN